MSILSNLPEHIKNLSKAAWQGAISGGPMTAAIFGVTFAYRKYLPISPVQAALLYLVQPVIENLAPQLTGHISNNYLRRASTQIINLSLIPAIAIQQRILSPIRLYSVWESLC